MDLLYVMPAITHMWMSEVNLCVLVLSLHHVGLRNQTWVISLGSKCLHPPELSSQA